MNLIDIASYQGDMVLKIMFDRNPSLDGVIVKLTQGTSFVTPQAKDWLDWLVSNNKPFGLYHYLDLYGAEAEAQHFAAKAKPYIGKCPLAIDYEANTIRMGTGYLKKCLDEVYRLTGVKPFVYVSQSFIATQDFGAIVSAGYPLWMAQYADMNPVHGFKESPWQKGSFSPWQKITMQQYTSCGYLEGWGHNLDFDLFHGNVEDWTALAKGKDAPDTNLKPADPSIVLAVLKNQYGTESDNPSRSSRLLKDGYDPESVQSKINQLYGISSKVKKDIGNEMSYLNSILWIVRS